MKLERKLMFGCHLKFELDKGKSKKTMTANTLFCSCPEMKSRVFQRRVKVLFEIRNITCSKQKQQK